MTEQVLPRHRHPSIEGAEGMSNPIRVATAILSERIFAGRPTKDGRGFKEPRYDVTSDVLVAIRDKVGMGNEIELASNGVVEFRIAILPPIRTLAKDPA